MPEQDGLSFCEEVRAGAEMATVPILFLSARWQTDEIVRGLDAGGDDYLTKPFELRELTARARALLRRAAPAGGQGPRLQVGDLSLDANTFQVTTPQRERVQLTSTEFKLLHHLMSAPNQAHSVRDLLDKVWQYPPGAGDADLVRAHIRNLRAKVEQDSADPRYIHTIHGVGYMVKTPE
jgi:DNA-binding response OmpR family regulator